MHCLAVRVRETRGRRGRSDLLARRIFLPLSTSMGIGNGHVELDRERLTAYSTSSVDSKSAFAPVAIAFALGALCSVGTSVSGGAYNPARAFAPALLSWDWRVHWLYWVWGGSSLAVQGGRKG